MPFELQNFDDPTLDPNYVAHLVGQRAADTSSRYGQLWSYFRNPITAPTPVRTSAMNANSRPYFQAQEVGLPPRITGLDRSSIYGEQPTNLRRKEVVIENDIAWRIHTMVDFLFGKPVSIRSTADDPSLAETIEQAIDAMFEANGGIAFLQEVAMLGAVYGFVDIALRTPADSETEPTPALGSGVSSASRPRSGRSAGRPGNPDTGAAGPVSSTSQEDGQRGPRGDRSNTQRQRVVQAARHLHLETVEAPRVLPILDDDDYRRVRYWIQRFFKHPARMAGPKRSWFSLARGRGASTAAVEVVEILGPHWWQRYEDGGLVAEGPNPLGRPPVVHIQNVHLPGSYEGLSDVEPLIPLQDELNTRLSDRANRVTYQSFKMYLGKGIDDFLERPVGPGQMWATQNPQASIEEFGSDSGSPSEEAHIEQTRQAMDKVSGVTPLAAGLICGNVGNLTSATALKVLLAGLLSRTAKKRLSYGAGVQRMVAAALEWMNSTGVLPTAPQDRRIEIHWPDPLPIDAGETLRNAQIKAQLGVPAERVLAELGYDRQVTDRNQD